ncbi:NfeD family protein [Tindallia californiensis]|uniref:Membrane-bound serine protease (ClpP class) n=1 Tax=Tindallia californiensis TaxID=159292 RepID=A0A1H3IST8_9FIRM|nr:NfeD family protein [Tindallia californiensis]SDY30790.1 membrane-bound serine protease (ClpP class) [Tindallia californiensis]
MDKKRLRRYNRMILAILSIILLSSVVTFAEGEGNVYIIPLEGEVGPAMEQFVAGSVSTALEDPDTQGIIFTIDTYGGRVDSAENISGMIIDIPVKTASFVTPRAISAGVLLTISADYVTMAPGSNIGSAETIPDTEKALSAWTGELRSVAQEKGRDPELVAAMADKRIAIQDVVEEGELLNLTAAEALHLELSDYTARGISEVLAVMELSNANTVELEISRAVRIAQVLTSSLVAPLLLSLGMIGLIVEVMTAGFGVGGTMSLIAFSLYFGGSILAGNTGMAVILVFLAAIALLLIEAMAPGFGIAGLGGLVLIIVSVVMASSTTGVAVVSLVVAFLMSIIALILIIKHAPKSSYFDRLTLGIKMTSDSGYISTERREDLVGKKGIVTSYLRPSGTVEVDGERIDAVSEGIYLEAGTNVQVIRMEGRRIVVKKMD